MATRNLIPRNSGEGGLGINNTPWGHAYFNSGHFYEGLTISGSVPLTGFEIPGGGSVIEGDASGVVMGPSDPLDTRPLELTSNTTMSFTQSGSTTMEFTEEGDVNIQNHLTVSGGIAVSGGGPIISGNENEVIFGPVDPSDSRPVEFSSNTTMSFAQGGDTTMEFTEGGDVNIANNLNVSGGITGDSAQFETLDLGSTTSPGTTYERLTIFRGSDGSDQNLEMGYRDITVTRNQPLSADQSTFAINQKGSNGERAVLFIDVDGEVGLGTTDPDGILTTRPAQAGQYGIHVMKPATSDSLGGIFVETDNTTSLYLKDRSQSPNSTIRLKAKGDSYFDGGSVGIGTTNPGHKLEISESSTWDALNIKSSYASGAGFTLSSNSRWSLISTSTGAGAGKNKLGFHLTQAEVGSAASTGYKMVIDDNGDVGIGTTTPQAPLTISKVHSDSFDGIDNLLILGATEKTNQDLVRGDGVGILFKIPVSTETQAVGARIAAVREGTTDSNSSTELVFQVSNNDQVLDDAMRITSNGRVGIGTDLPAGPLHAYSTIASQINLTRALDIRGSANGASAEIHGGALEGTTPSMGGGIGFTLKDSDGAGSGTDTEGLLYFKVKDSGGSLTEKMRITSDGDVGIGTTNPGHKLEISESSTWDVLNIKSSYASGAGFTLSSNSRWSLISTSTAAGAGKNKLAFHLTQAEVGSAASTGYKMVIDDNGNVGIGTTTPGNFKLYVNGNTKIDGDLTVIGKTITEEVETVTTSNGVIFEGSAADNNELLLKAGTLTADRTITLPDASGTVALVGASPSTHTLSSHSDVSTATPSTGQVLKWNGATWAPAADDTGSTINSINDINDVTLSSLANGDALVYDGTKWINSQPSEPAFFISDSSLKDKVTAISSASKKLQSIRGVEFTWNNEAPDSLSGKKDVGVIAQEVQKVIPEAVKADSDEKLTVAYHKIIPLLIETIKEQEKRISELEKRI